jgi:hypothetical protein
MFKQSVLAVAVTGAMAAGVARAESIVIDVGAAGGSGVSAFPIGDANTLTGLFDSMQFFANTTTVQYDNDGTPGQSVGDTFSDSGNANITGPIPTVDFEGINLAALGGGTVGELTVAWNNLNGFLSGVSTVGTSTVFTQTYTSGTFNFYFQEPGNIAFGTTTGSGDDTGVTDGLLVLTLELNSALSSGNAEFDSAGNFLSGSSQINTAVTYALPGFWLMGGTDDFANLLLNNQIVLSFIDQNTDNVAQVGCTASDGPNCLFRVFSDHDGSIEFTSVPVPVPGVLGLVGAGLLGLGLIGRGSRRMS